MFLCWLKAVFACNHVSACLGINSIHLSLKHVLSAWPRSTFTEVQFLCVLRKVSMVDRGRTMISSTTLLPVWYSNSISMTE
ncbi:hypothetical protein UPYG_G00004250 [Umbra pygmaea]|uniref:Secreted protein n=1 Tax=Umbra pygmaea TaxID=75934 RepID=A0ABD0XKE7_UMBPY